MWRGGGFSASKEVAAVIDIGMSIELPDALLVTLGSCFKSLGDISVQVARGMYTAMPSTGLVANAAEGETILSQDPAKQGASPSMLIEARDDKAAGLPVTRIAATCLTKEVISSAEDDLSLDKTPCGEVLHSLSVSKQRPP